MIIRSLVWDPWNSAHIRKHHVSIAEAEEACESEIKTKETYDGRLMVFGVTKKGRFLITVVASREEESFYVVTARSMNRKERRWYQQ